MIIEKKRKVHCTYHKYINTYKYEHKNPIIKKEKSILYVLPNMKKFETI